MTSMHYHNQMTTIPVGDWYCNNCAMIFKWNRKNSFFAFLSVCFRKTHLHILLTSIVFFSFLFSCQTDVTSLCVIFFYIDLYNYNYFVCFPFSKIYLKKNMDFSCKKWTQSQFKNVWKKNRLNVENNILFRSLTSYEHATFPHSIEFFIFLRKFQNYFLQIHSQSQFNSKLKLK